MKIQAEEAVPPQVYNEIVYKYLVSIGLKDTAKLMAKESKIDTKDIKLDNISNLVALLPSVKFNK